LTVPLCPTSDTLSESGSQWTPARLVVTETFDEETLTFLKGECSSGNRTT